MARHRPNPQRDREVAREKATRTRAEAKNNPEAFRELVLEVMSYDPETGAFTLKRDRVGAHGKTVAKAGDRAEGKKNDGYLTISIRKVHFLAHRVAWLIMTGEWPPSMIDHEDRCKTNNRWKNLRLADQVLNQHNRVKPDPRNRTGLMGVRLSNGKYPQALIRVARRMIYLGTFDTPEEAHRAYMKAKQAVIQHGPGIADQLAAAAPRRR